MRRSAALVIAITRGVIRSQQMRRSAMFVMLVIALILLFLGATFLNETLLERPALFLCYWAACAWLTLTAVLLALFDLLAVRAAAARERRRVKAEIFGARPGDDV